MTGQSLSGLRVIDASRVLAGPYCAQMLGDQGADVIKVESPDGDETRTFGAPVNEGGAAYFQALNRNKRGIVLNMGLPAAREVFWQLVAKADVLIENYKPGTLRAWGVADPKTISARFPTLVHCRITGFGDDGPIGGLPGYDAAIQAASGLMSVNGEAGGDPLRLGIPVVDLSTGMQAAIAVLAALHERSRSGLGQICDVALYDCALGVAHPHLPNYLWSGVEPRRTGNGHPNIAPYDRFETATCSVYVAVGNDRQFATLCEELELHDLVADARFRRNLDRITHRAALGEALGARMKVADGRALAARLQRLGVPVAPVLGVAEVACDTHTAHRQMVIEQDGYRGVGFPVKLSRTSAVLRRVPPLLGEHTDTVLREAGLDDQRIASLRALGALGPRRAGEPLPILPSNKTETFA